MMLARAALSKVILTCGVVALFSGCSSSQPRDLNYGTDVGLSFKPPDSALVASNSDASAHDAVVDTVIDAAGEDVSDTAIETVGDTTILDSESQDPADAGVLRDSSTSSDN
jgi:hypothetical protein